MSYDQGPTESSSFDQTTSNHHLRAQFLAFVPVHPHPFLSPRKDVWPTQHGDVILSLWPTTV